MGLPAAPEWLESYDISNTGSEDIVASMVVFRGSRPAKERYRRFRIKELDGPPGAYPLGTERFGLAIPIFGMVKDDRHRTRALVTPAGREIGIKSTQAVFALIGRIQEETHRFAITYNRQSHGKRVRGSTLDEIPGVGPARRTALLKHFKSLRAIREASLEELLAVVPKNTAQAVYLWARPDLLEEAEPAEEAAETTAQS